MKKNDLAEIKKNTTVEIIEKVKKLRQEIGDLYLDKSLAKLKNVKIISHKRKNLAQLLTILRQKQLLKSLEEKNAKK